MERFAKLVMYKGEGDKDFTPDIVFIGTDAGEKAKEYIEKQKKTLGAIDEERVYSIYAIDYAIEIDNSQHR